MQASSRTLLAFLGAGLIAGVGGLGWKLTRPMQGPIKGPSTTAPPIRSNPDTQLTQTQLADSSAKAVGKSTNLSVLVMSEDGQLLPEARVLLTDPEGELSEYAGSADLRNCAHGEWDLKIRQKGLMNHFQSVLVEQGTTERLVVRMARVIRIRGTASTVFGEPVGTWPIWFLAEGESHPTQRQGVMKIAGGVITTAGTFQVDIPRSGPYQVSIGPIGEVIMAAKETVELRPGGLSELSVVMLGGTDLEVIIDPVPLRVADGGVQLQAALMVRERDLNAGRQARKRPGFLKRQPLEPGVKHPRNRNKSGAEDSDPAGGKDSAGPPREGLLGPANTRETRETRANNNQGASPTGQEAEAKWREFRRAPVSPEGLCDFGILPTDLDMRLAISRPRDRYESTETFRLVADARTTLRVQVPDKRPGHLIKAQPIGELPLFMAVVPASSDALKPGFTWK